MAFPFLVAVALGCCDISGSVKSVDGAPLSAHVHFNGPANALGLRYTNNVGVHGALNLTATSANNWLAQGRYATLDAAIGKRVRNVDVTVAGTNLTNAVSGRFTRIGLGTPYPMPGEPPRPRDALVLRPASVRVILTVR